MTKTQASRPLTLENYVQTSVADEDFESLSPWKCFLWHATKVFPEEYYICPIHENAMNKNGHSAFDYGNGVEEFFGLSQDEECRIFHRDGDREVACKRLIDFVYTKGWTC